MKRILLLLPLVLLIGCARTDRDEKQDILAVYMHEPGKYSVLLRDGKELKVQGFSIYPAPASQGVEGIKIFDDVPPESNMWYEAHWMGVEGCSEGYTKVYIHIHRSSELSPAGWNHGKFGSGSTVIVEDSGK